MLSAKSSPADADGDAQLEDASVRDVIPRGRRVCRYVVGSADEVLSGVVSVSEDLVVP